MEILPGSVDERSYGSHHLHHLKTVGQMGVVLKRPFGVCLQMKTGANISVLILATHMISVLSLLTNIWF